jgi:hypothetical protein
MLYTPKASRIQHLLLLLHPTATSWNISSPQMNSSMINNKTEMSTTKFTKPSALGCTKAQTLMKLSNMRRRRTWQWINSIRVNRWEFRMKLGFSHLRISLSLQHLLLIEMRSQRRSMDKLGNKNKCKIKKYKIWYRIMTKTIYSLILRNSRVEFIRR